MQNTACQIGEILAHGNVAMEGEGVSSEAVKKREVRLGEIYFGRLDFCTGFQWIPVVLTKSGKNKTEKLSSA